MTKERRGGPRVPAEHEVKVTVLSVPEVPALENKTFDCRTEDISARGMRFSVDAELPKGCPIELRISDGAANGGFWHIGRVAWVRGGEGEKTYRVGVHFTETPEATLTAWEELLEEKLSRRAI